MSIPCNYTFEYDTLNNETKMHFIIYNVIIF